MRDVPFNTIFIGSYDTICSALCKYTDSSKDDLSAGALFLAGGLSGMVGWSMFDTMPESVDSRSIALTQHKHTHYRIGFQGIVFPLDVVKSRMHLLETSSGTPSAFRVASNIIKTEGVRRLYAVCRIAATRD
jgi:hypothetical protein